MPLTIPDLRFLGANTHTLREQTFVRDAIEKSALLIALRTGLTIIGLPDKEFCFVNSDRHSTFCHACRAELGAQVHCGDSFEIIWTSGGDLAVLARTIFHTLSHVLLFRHSPDRSVWDAPVGTAERNAERDQIIVGLDTFDVCKLERV